MPNSDSMNSKKGSIWVSAKIPLGAVLVALGAGGGLFANQFTALPVMQRYVDAEMDEHCKEERMIYLPRETADIEFRHIKQELAEIKAMLQKR